MSKFTKTAIMQSYVKLLDSTPFDRITVKDIVDDCGVNRNTFYYNFEDIYALVDELLSEEVARVLEKQRTCNSWQGGLYYGAEFVLKNKRAVYHLYHSTKKDQLERYFKRVVYDAAAEVVKHDPPLAGQRHEGRSRSNDPQAECAPRQQRPSGDFHGLCRTVIRNQTNRPVCLIFGQF